MFMYFIIKLVGWDKLFILAKKIQMKNVRIFSYLTFIFLMTSCTELIHVNSTPIGASLRVDGITQGLTPYAGKYGATKNGITISVLKEGYEAKSFQVKAVRVLKFLPFLYKFETGVFDVELTKSTGTPAK